MFIKTFFQYNEYSNKYDNEYMIKNVLYIYNSVNIFSLFLSIVWCIGFS